jgi:hypothetical protein
LVLCPASLFYDLLGQKISFCLCDLTGHTTKFFF